jgi:hypothetical protein
MSISRRSFLGTTALAGLAANAFGKEKLKLNAKGIPTRILGRTGVRVTILGFGCGSRFVGYMEHGKRMAYQDKDKGVAALNRAMDLGINYVDSAYLYGFGKSEEWVGEVMKTRRKEAFLVTKVDKRDGDGAMRRIEDSLKRLQTDHVDLIHVHGLASIEIEPAEDLRQMEAKDGVLNVLYKLRDQKVARFIGVTSHQQPKYLKMALERDDFDCTQMALNAGLKDPTEKLGDPAADCFETVAMPVALRKKMGVTAMKVFCQDQLRDALSESVATPETLIRYAMSLPVAAAIIGMPTIEYLEQNVQIAKSFKPMTKEEMQKMSGDLAPRYKLAMNRFFENHIPC